MKITFLVSSPNFSGGLKVILIHADNLRKRGHDVLVVSVPPRKPSFRDQLRSIKSGNGWIKYDPNPPSHRDEFDLNYKVIDKYRPFTDEDLPDADILFFSWWQKAEWANDLSESKGRKVHFIQGHEVFEYLPQERAKAVYKMPFYKIAVSKWLQNIVYESYGGRKPDLVGNTVDLSHFSMIERAKSSDFTIGFLYSTVAKKNTKLSIEVITKIKEFYPSVKVVSFGDLKPNAQLPLPEWVEFHHAPSQDDIPVIYGRADVWLFSSFSEGFGLPLLEAMACGTPVVATRAGAAEQYIDQTTGALVDGDLDSFMAALTRIIKMNDAEWRKMSNAAYDKVKGYTWEDATQLLENSLHRALDEVGSNDNLHE